jgi:transcriptional regulator with XRE-family HTH domain
LGIEENRYTRYERAEVEPSLTLIHKICVTLQVSPNDLLGYDERPCGNGE